MEQRVHGRGNPGRSPACPKHPKTPLGHRRGTLPNRGVRPRHRGLRAATDPSCEGCRDGEFPREPRQPVPASLGQRRVTPGTAPAARTPSPPVRDPRPAPAALTASESSNPCRYKLSYMESRCGAGGPGSAAAERGEAAGPSSLSAAAAPPPAGAPPPAPLLPARRAAAPHWLSRAGSAAPLAGTRRCRHAIGWDAPAASSAARWRRLTAPHGLMAAAAVPRGRPTRRRTLAYL